MRFRDVPEMEQEGSLREGLVSYPPPPLPAADTQGVPEARRIARRAELALRRQACRLGTAGEVPELRRRPFIKAHYRLEQPCLRHMWCCHNELGNIWTHV